MIAEPEHSRRPHASSWQILPVKDTEKGVVLGASGDREHDEAPTTDGREREGQARERVATGWVLGAHDERSGWRPEGR